MADEREQREARERHADMLAELRDLRGDLDFRVVEIIRDQDAREMDDRGELERQRAWVRGELVSLQRRVDQSINNFR